MSEVEQVILKRTMNDPEICESVLRRNRQLIYENNKLRRMNEALTEQLEANEDR